MNQGKLVVRGNLDEFIHTGGMIMIILWVLIAISIFIMSGGKSNQIEIQKFIAGLFAFILAVPALGILIQTISVDDKYLYYSSNFFPLIKRKILIENIYSIGYRRNFMPITDPTGISKLNMAITDEPVVGMGIYGKQGEILGGFNTKVYHPVDITRIITRLKEINPEISTLLI